MPAILAPLLGLLGTVLGWLVAGMAGRILLSMFTQGAVVAATLYWGGDIAEWVTDKMLIFVQNSGFWQNLQSAFSELGNFPTIVLQLWGCFGAREAFVAFIGGQISSIGVAVIARKLL